MEEQTTPSICVDFVETNIKVDIPQFLSQNHSFNLSVNALLNNLCKNKVRKRLIKLDLQKDLEDGKIVLCIADRKVLLEYLFHSLKKYFKVGYLHGNVTSTKRKKIAEQMSKYQLLLATNVVECFIPSVKAPLPFDTIYMVNPTGASRFNTRTHLHRWMEKRPVTIRYYVDDDPWSQAVYKGHLKEVQQQGWEIM